MIAPLRPADPPRAWTVSDLLTWTAGHWKKLGFTTPRLDAEVLLAHALSCTRVELYTGYHKVVEPAERARFRALVERRNRGEPVAYITGSREFHSLRFEVSRAVLIPRPETEHLVDLAVEHLRSLCPGSTAYPAPGPGTAPASTSEPVAENAPAAGIAPLPGTAAEAGATGTAPDPETAPGTGAAETAPGTAAAGAAEYLPLRVLDLGTGSGNIAVALAVRIPEARVVAVDVSPEALEVARRNAERHAVADRVELLEGDLFAPLGEPRPGERFQAIVSNPPYIPPREVSGLCREVREFEPLLALLDRREDGGGMGFHRAILGRAAEFLDEGGLLAVEVGAGQSRAVEELFREAGFRAVLTRNDLAGIARVVGGLRP